VHSRSGLLRVQIGFVAAFALTPLYALLGAVLAFVGWSFAAAAGAGKVALKLTALNLKFFLKYLTLLPLSVARLIKRTFDAVVRVLKTGSQNKPLVIEEGIELLESEGVSLELEKTYKKSARKPFALAKG